MNILKQAALGAVVLAMLAGCQSTPQQQNAAGGAALGAVGGALVGQAIGGNTKSTVIGAGAGALLGAVLATSGNPKPNEPEMCRYQAANGKIYVAECDQRYYNGQY